MVIPGISERVRRWEGRRSVGYWINHGKPTFMFTKYIWFNLAQDSLAWGSPLSVFHWLKFAPKDSQHSFPSSAWYIHASVLQECPKADIWHVTYQLRQKAHWNCSFHVSRGTKIMGVGRCWGTSSGSYSHLNTFVNSSHMEATFTSFCSLCLVSWS